MIGARLGCWILDRELGRGGMGCVYLAHRDPADAEASDQAAIKVLGGRTGRRAGLPGAVPARDRHPASTRSSQHRALPRIRPGEWPAVFHHGVRAGAELRELAGAEGPNTVAASARRGLADRSRPQARPRSRRHPPRCETVQSAAQESRARESESREPETVIGLSTLHSRLSGSWSS